MTPNDLEARLPGLQTGATVTAVVDEFKSDSDWTVTTFTLTGRPVRIDLVHRPTGTAYTLTAHRMRDVSDHTDPPIP